MATRVYLDGRIVDEIQARVSVFDRGFLYGDSIYEVTRTTAGRPLDLGRHLDRLERSAEAIGLALPPRADTERAVGDTVAAAANADSYIRIIVTRGAGEIGLDPALADRPLLIVLVKPLVVPPAELYQRGVEVAVVDTRRNSRRALDPAIKSGNYLNNILGLREARARGAYECIMLNAEGHLAEGSTSNLFLVAGGTVVTPVLDDGMLVGITRGRVLEMAAAAGIPTAERHVLPDELRGADEAFLTSSLRGVLPITRVDGKAVASGAVGPTTKRLAAAWDAFIEGNKT